MHKPNLPAACSLSPSSAFSDSTCLRRVVARLVQLRNQQAMSRENIAKMARVKEEVIRRAEESGVTPTSRIFKAWAAALGTSWDELWSECMRPARQEDIVRVNTPPKTAATRRKTHVVFRM